MAQATPRKHLSPEIFDNLWRGLQEVALWGSSVVALFLLVALFTYSGSDPSWSHSTDPGPVSNAGGVVGAYVAGFLFELFGWFAYVMPLLIAYGGWLVYREQRAREEDNDRPSRILLLVQAVGLLLVVLSATALLTTHISPVDTGFKPGGILGESFHGMLVAWFNRFGASLLLLGLLVSGITLLTGLSWFWVMDAVGAVTLNLYDWLRQRLQRYRQGGDGPTDDQLAYGYADADADAGIDSGAGMGATALRQEASEEGAADGLNARLQGLRNGLSERVSGLRAGVMRRLGREPEVVPEDYWQEEDELLPTQPPYPPQMQAAATAGAAGPAPAAAVTTPVVAGMAPMSADDSSDLPDSSAGLMSRPIYAEAREAHRPTATAVTAPPQPELTAPYEGEPRIGPLPGELPGEMPDELPGNLSTEMPPAGQEVPQQGGHVEPVIQFPWEVPQQAGEPVIADDPTVVQAPAELPTGPATPPSAGQTVPPQPQRFDAPPSALSSSASAAPLRPTAAVDAAAVMAPISAPLSDPSALPSHPSLPGHAQQQPRMPAQTAMPVQAPPPPEPAALPPLPSLALLDPAENIGPAYTRDVLEKMSRLLEEKLADFRVKVQVVAVHPGPVITRFELLPAPGIKVSRITNLSKDLARSMSVSSVRVVEVIPGKSTIGLEIPNSRREIVRLSEVFHSPQYDHSHSPLSMALGKDIGGKPVVVDLAKMPHLLVAGTTGSGKSVAVNAMILSLLFKARPDEVRMIMIDPKMLELSIYDDIPHLLAPVVTDMKEAAHALRWCVVEMERRYQLMAAMGVRNLKGFNTKVQAAIDAGTPIPDPLQPPLEGICTSYLEPLPFIVVIVDELADLMMVVGKKIEELIARLAQKARAAGLHLILATQRPSVDVITGLIKANIPTRIAFQVSSRIDSRTILDQMGAEALLGMGDMLYLPPGTAIPMRVHGAFVDDHEVHNVVDELKAGYETNYLEGLLEEGGTTVPDGVVVPGDPVRPDEEADVLYDDAVRVVTETRRASVSGVQRRLRIGYNRAARLVETMEAAGVVGPLQSNGSREVLAPPPVEP